MNSAPPKPSADDRPTTTRSVAMGAPARLLRRSFSPRATAARPFRDGQQVCVARLGTRRALAVAVARLSGLRSARPCALAATPAARAPARLQADAGGDRLGRADHRARRRTR